VSAERPDAADEPIEVLAWDSAFFGVRVARLKPGRSTAADLDDARAACAREGVDVVTFLADPGDAESVRRLEDAGFRLVDVRVTLERPLPGAPTPPGREGAPSVRIGRPDDRDALRTIARSAHKDSRFSQDPGFAPHAGRFFETWIERSFEGFADVVLVAEMHGDAALEGPAGYVTCRVDRSGEGWIGLLGVAARKRGRGVGKALVAEAVRWCAEQGAGRALVATQARNVGGLRLYEWAGYRVSDVGLWYHQWRARPA